MHIAVDVKNGKIVSLEVTKQDVHDSKMFMDPVDGAGDRAKVARVLADGAYDSTSDFSYLSEKVIEPVIKKEFFAQGRGHHAEEAVSGWAARRPWRME